MGIDKEDYISPRDINNIVLDYQKEYKKKKNNQIYNKDKLKKDLGIILYYFDAYIDKFARALKKIGYIDNNIRTMYKLFGVPLEEAQEIVSIVLKYYSYQEVKNELTLLFIERVQKFDYRAERNPNAKSGTPMFPGYIKAYFPFVVKNWISKISKNPLNTMHQYSYIEDGGDENSDDETQDLSYYIIDKEVPMEVEIDLLEGKDFENIRNILTEQELIIIQEYYINKLKMLEIQNKYLLTRNEFKDILDSALDKLRKYFADRM